MLPRPFSGIVWICRLSTTLPMDAVSDCTIGEVASTLTDVETSPTCKRTSTRAV